MTSWPGAVPAADQKNMCDSRARGGTPLENGSVSVGGSSGSRVYVSERPCGGVR